MTSVAVVGMVDTVGTTAKNIPTATGKVAGYVTGSADIQWTAAEWAMFPHSVHVTINQENGSDAACDVYDYETGAWTELDVVAKVKANAGQCTVYVNQANVESLTKALTAAGMQNHGVELWLANWDLDKSEATALVGTFINEFKVVAVQWASPSSNPDIILPGSTKTLKQANCDLSVTLVGWPAVVTPPAPPVDPPPVTETVSVTFTSTDGGKTFTVTGKL
jgi:hypothetical protein